MKIHGHSSFLLKVAEEANKKEKENKVGEQLIETQLRENPIKNAPNAKEDGAGGTIEQQLNEASKDFYPHRNPIKTGDQRPVNALPKELGNASVEKKDERYEKANKSAVFNLHQEKYAGYFNYKNKNGFNLNNEKVAKIDSLMSKIMKNAQKREMTEEEKEIITAMKQKKQELLG